MTNEANDMPRLGIEPRCPCGARDFKGHNPQGTNPEAGAAASTRVQGDSTKVQGESYTGSYSLPTFGKWLDDLCQEDA